MLFSKSQLPIVAVFFFALLTFALVKIHPLTQPERNTASDTFLLENKEENPAGLSIVIPKADRVQFYSNRHRIAGNTLPGSRAYINEEEVTVYPTGAFAGIVSVPLGESITRIRVVLPNEEIIQDHIVFNRLEAPQTIRPDSKIDQTGFPVMGRIRTNRTPVFNQPETDRLGGRTHSYLNQGVLVKITGQTSRFYQIKLGINAYVYVPRHTVDTTRQKPAFPSSAVNQIQFSPDDNVDLLSISLDEQLPYTSRLDKRRERLIIDLFGATLETASTISVPESNHPVKRIEAISISDNHVRIHIHLNTLPHWGHDLSYDPDKNLIVKVRKAPFVTSQKKPLDGVLIALDAGHGGDNTGALGATGVMEKDLVLELTKKIEEKLIQAGAHVFMTRRYDHDLSLTERATRIASSGATALLSIHANSISYSHNPLGTHGTGVYYGNSAHEEFAKHIHRHLTELPLRNYGLIGDFNFTLTEMPELPVALIETAFLSHPEDEMKLLDPAFQDDIAEKLVTALTSYFAALGRASEPGSI